MSNSSNPRESYGDPRLHGSLCDDCPLRDGVQSGKFVPSRRVPNALGVIVAEGPGPREVEAGAPLVGPTGRRVQGLLAQARLDMRDMHLTNAMLCPPVSKSSAELKRATACCLPRLKNELHEVAKPHLALGTYAIRALTGLVDIDAERGYVRPRDW